jgi:hypothetical protein
MGRSYKLPLSLFYKLPCHQSVCNLKCLNKQYSSDKPIINKHAVTVKYCGRV